MNTIETLFWVLFALVFYTYVGYGILLFGMVVFKRFMFGKSQPFISRYEPNVTLLVAAWNERDCIRQKVKNSLALDYPRAKLNLLFISDGSTDGTAEILEEYEDVTLLHSSERLGKTAALNRAMLYVKTPIVIFSDANALLNRQAVREIVKHYQDPKVGCVAGEKRIAKNEKGGAASTGEGLYWKYESLLKKWDNELYSTIGAAGELFSIRTKLYSHVQVDTILDDFMISLQIVNSGCKIAYEPNAFAVEASSANVHEEMKRKIRIAAGGIQAMFRLPGLLNPFKHGILTVQYISHRVLRWSITPITLFMLLPLNLLLLPDNQLYSYLLVGQLVFYLAGFAGWLLENRQVRVKILYVPYYFLIMNISVLRAIIRVSTGNQSVLWERAKRAG